MRRVHFILGDVATLRNVIAALGITLVGSAPLLAQLPPPTVPSLVPSPRFDGPRTFPRRSGSTPTEPAKPAPEGEEQKLPPPPAIVPRSVQVDFADGSQLRLLLADEKIEIETPHGKLAVPAENVRRMEFAPRISPEGAARLKELLPKISSTTVAEREEAVRGILALGEAAVPAVAELAKNTEAEASEYALDLLEKLKRQLPKGRETRAQDLIETSDSRIIGHVTMPELKIATAQFGPLSMRVSDVRSIRSLALVLADSGSDADEESGSGNVLPDPGNLSGYAGQTGKTFRFQVTGAVDGSIWGTGIYTTDTDLSTAAVHAGTVQAGKAGVVKVKILGGQAGFAGSTANGVSSSSYDTYPTSYEIVTKKSR